MEKAAQRLFRTLRIKGILLLLMTLSLGCGDCIQVSDFVDFVDMPPDAATDLDMNTTDQDQPDDSTSEDAGDDKDVLFNFDFDFGEVDLGPTDEFELMGIAPSSGPLEGGTQVRIDGKGLVDGSLIFFASQSVRSTLSGGSLVARTPPGSGPGPVSVKVVAPDGRSRVMVDAFRYVANLKVDQVIPNRVPVYGGVDVEIRGQGFLPRTQVSFGGHQALRVEVLSSTYLRAMAPPQSVGIVDLRLTTPDATVLKTGAVTYYQPLEIISVEPSSGVSAGGETVVVRARGVDANVSVNFDGIPAQVLNVNLAQQAVQVRTPPGVGLVDVALQTENDAAIAEDAFFFRNNNDPTIAAVMPRSGPVAGGNEVVIIGYGLANSARSFVFGSNTATVVSRTETRAVVQAPAGAMVGAVDVVLQENGAAISQRDDAYMYVPNLALQSATPNTGPIDGGTMVRVTGQGFLDVVRVTLNGVAAEFQIVSDTEIVVTTPAGRAGAADIEFVTASTRSKLPNGFTYIEPLEVWGFTPMRGSVAGGTFVAVRGRGFAGEVGVTLNGVAGREIRRLDRNNLTFRTPPGPPGLVDLAVTSGGMTATGPYQYGYFNPASPFGGASGDSINGSVNVTVYSAGGGPIEKAFVMLSTRADTPYQGFTDVNGMVTLSGADVLGAQTITATAAGYSTTTMQTVDAENITLFLNMLNPPPSSGGGAPPPFATIKGRIQATGKFSDPADETTYDMAVVATTQRAVFSGNPAPGLNSIVLGDGAYEIRTRIGDMAVVGLCGTFNANTQQFTPQLAAIQRHLFVSDQQVVDVDLICDIPLNEVISFKLVNTDFAPTGPDNNTMEVFWDFGFEGVFRSPSRGRSLSTIVSVPNQPKLEGIFADVTLIALGGSSTGFGLPFSRVIQEGLTATGQPILLPPLLDVPDPVSPVPGGVVEDNLIRFRASNLYPAHFSYMALRNNLGIAVWEWIIPAGEQSAVIPTFPSFSQLPVTERPQPLIQEPLYLTLVSARVKGGFVYESFTYRDIATEVWRAYSLNSWTIRLPAP